MISGGHAFGEPLLVPLAKDAPLKILKTDRTSTGESWVWTCWEMILTFLWVPKSNIIIWYSLESSFMLIQWLSMLHNIVLKFSFMNSQKVIPEKTCEYMTICGAMSLNMALLWSDDFASAPQASLCQTIDEANQCTKYCRWFHEYFSFCHALNHKPQLNTHSTKQLQSRYNLEIPLTGFMFGRVLGL